MPISLRLPLDTEAKIAEFGARHGLSKTAVIVRSIEEFLAAHAQPSSFQVYEEAMRAAAAADAAAPGSGTALDAAEKRARKLASRDAIRRKHATRSALASKALKDIASASRRVTRKAT